MTPGIRVAMQMAKTEGGSRNGWKELKREHDMLEAYEAAFPGLEEQRAVEEGEVQTPHQGVCLIIA
jgi:hypothetical protein